MTLHVARVPAVRIASLVLSACLAVSAFGTLSTSPSETAVLMRNYLRFILSQQVERQVAILADDALPGDRGEIEEAAHLWNGNQMGTIRQELEAAFGDESREQFEEFVSIFTTAEQSLDAELLQEVSMALRLHPMPADYNALKRTSLDSVLLADVQKASAWLGEVQTWMDLRRRNQEVPPLAVWLERDVRGAAPIATASAPAATPQPVKRPGGRLAAAEAESSGNFEMEEDDESPLDAFDSMRRTRRERAMQEAEAGMKQVADERRAAEEEYAAKKLASAQAEADAMKQHAEKLAAVEQEALEQRKNSWGNRLKSIVGSTIGAATGAFTGGIGTRAGQEAANAIFNN